MADDSATDCLFERLRQFQQRAPDSAEVARSLAARINARLNSHDKHIRQTTLDNLWCKNSGAIQVLLSILESSKDTATSSYIISIFREVLCLKQGKGKKNSAANEPAEVTTKKKDIKKSGKENKLQVAKKVNNQNRIQSVQHFISLNGTQNIIRTILATHGRRENSTTIDLMLQDLVWVLAAVAPKDPKFAIKVRMQGCVRCIHLILKAHSTDNKLIFPLLVIMKQLSKNTIATSILIRDGVISTYERVLVSLGCIPTARLRLTLDAIDYFSKNKAGRRALCTKKYVQTLQRFCARCPDEPEFDELLARVCSVISLCLKHQALPVSASSPATFNLNPIIKGTNDSWPCAEYDDEGANSDDKLVNSDSDDEDMPESESEEPDELTDLELDDMRPKSMEETTKSPIQAGASVQSALWIKPNERDIEDLKKYFIFFKEFGSYNKQIRLVKSRTNSRGSIMEDFSYSGNNRQSALSLSHISTLGNSDIDNTTSSCSAPILLQCFNDFKCQKIPENPSGTSSSSLKILKDISKYSSYASVYAIVSTRVRSVIPFLKAAYPDIKGGQGLCQPEPLNKMDRSACRAKLLMCVDRAINPESYTYEVVYDLDQLTNSNTNLDNSTNKSSETPLLTNTDEQDLSKSNNMFSMRLSFESRFESGNLRKAIQIGPREYELILMPDVNSNKRHQWFYFEVRNMQQNRPYVFNIVNCEKADSQFNFGMKPVIYSVRESLLGRPGWVRTGTDICYYRNSYHYAKQKCCNKYYLTATFTIEFPHANDICYIAYHFPFTYSMMMTRLWQWNANLPENVYFRIEPLCYSLNNNEVPLLTISAEDTQTNPITEREIIFLTARVHPGESNASWVMDGTLRYLLGDTSTSVELRAKYVFKIVPMLNPEGVINGCHRCGLTNEDLNRRWCKPSPVLHPSIYHTKGLIEYLMRVWKKPPAVYCDYHGHSRKKNVFFYGCAGAESWCSQDRLLTDEPVKYLMLPALMHRISPAFSLASCSFRVERERESTARVTVWRHLGVTRSYTMEASFCGFDRGPFKGFHLNTQHLQNVGSDFCEALNGLADNSTVDLQLTKDFNGALGGDSEGGSTDSMLKTDSDEDFD